MSSSPTLPDPSSYESALERTAPAEEFTSEAIRKQLERTASDRQLDATPQQYLSRTSTDTTPSLSLEQTADITRFGDTQELPADLLVEPQHPGPRYEVTGVAGAGGTAKVYAVRDRSLNRTIAVKFLRRSSSQKGPVRQRFIGEARTTAMLEHPNIMPVHDIGANRDGEVYFTMKNIVGGTVGDAIRTARRGEPVTPEFRTLDGRIRLFLKVCDGLSFAHAHGFVHQDIKPDNIMLGEYGEVLLLDWGSALANDERVRPGRQGMYGTPAYMSPEQARRERADERSDIYCLGATMFHALLLRHPAWAEDPDAFWEKKRQGVLDPLTDEERRRVPRPLLAIVLKALAADPAGRYPDVNALADDLKRYQAGLAVAAYRESVVEKFIRWYRRNCRVFWISAASTTLVLGAGGLLFREKLKELVTWRFFARDTFDTYQAAGDLASRWISYRSPEWDLCLPDSFSSGGTWTVDSGRLVGNVGGGFANLTFRRGIPGDMRVEWNVTPVGKPNNLNCYIAGETRHQGYTFHVGGFGHDSRIALTKGRRDLRLAEAELPSPLALGTTYRFRMEKEGRHVRLFVDGRRVIDYRDDFELSGAAHQTFGFEVNNGNTLHIDNVEVAYHPLPMKVSPLAAADRFLEHGLYTQALEQYREIVRIYPTSDIAITARYRMGECLAHLDSTTQALAVYESLSQDYPRHELAALALYETSQLHRRQGDTAVAYERLELIGSRFAGHPVLRKAFGEISSERMRWFIGYVEDWIEDTSTDTAVVIERIMSEARRVQRWGTRFGAPLADNLFLTEAATELNSKYVLSAEQLIKEFPHQRIAHVAALLREGAAGRVLEEYRDVPLAYAEALLSIGEYERVLVEVPSEPRVAVKALLKLGRYEELLRDYAGEHGECADALYRLGRLDEMTRRFPGQMQDIRVGLGHAADVLEALERDPVERARGLVGLLGRPEEALSLLRPLGPPYDLSVRVVQAQALCQQGRFAEVIRRFGRSESMESVVADSYHALGRTRDICTIRPTHADDRCKAYLIRGMLDSAANQPMASAIDVICVLWLAGRTDVLLARFGERKPLRASLLLAERRVDSLTASYPGERALCARGLASVGRVDALLKDYSDQREVCIDALFAAGRAEEAIARFPESAPRYGAWLAENGSAAEALSRYGIHAWARAVALTHLGQYREALRRGHVEDLTATEEIEIAAIQAVHAAAKGDYRTADSIAHVPRTFGLHWSQQRFSRQLLGPVLAGFSGHTGTMKRELRVCAAHVSETCSKMLWHEALYLAGDISDEQFLAQPVQYLVAERLRFLDAILADIRGSSDTAVAAYRSLANAPIGPETAMALANGTAGILDDSVLRSPALQYFVRWRLLANDVSRPRGTHTL